MKRFFLLLFFIGATIIGKTQSTNDPLPDPNGPVLTFDTLTYNYKNVIAGTILHQDFHFTNTGKSPLIIITAFGSGGTVAGYPQDPIPPLGKGVITVMMWTAGKTISCNKTSTVVYNTEGGMVVLHMNANIVPDTARIAIMTFESDTFNFGTVTQGTMVEHDFKFTNTGKSVLIISSCSTSCSCDAADMSREPIPPKHSSTIHYRLDTYSKMGTLDKTVYVAYNDGQIIILHVRGKVIIPPDPK